MGLWTLGRNYLAHIFSAEHPTRGVWRAIGASLPAMALAILISNISALLIWQYDPVLASQAQTYAMFRVLLGTFAVFLLFLMAGAFHKVFRQEFPSSAVSR